MFENLDDPKRQALLALAAGLLSPVRGRGFSGFGEALGQGVQSGLLGFNQAQRTQESVKRGEMERKLEQERLNQFAQQQKAQDYFGQGLKQFFQPGIGAQPSTPVDDSGLPMPSPNPSFDRAGFSNYLAQNPATASQALNFMPPPKKPPEYKVVGNRLVKIDDAGATEAYAPPQEMKDWQNPEYIKAQMAIRAAGKPQVTVDTRQESEFSKEIGKQNAKDYADLMKSGASAQSQQAKLSRLESLLAKSGNTGKLTPTTMELKAAAASFGINVDEKLPFQQAAQALSNEIALSLRNPAGGAGMPGALSDRDREFLQNMVPNLGKTPEGNKLIIETMKRLTKREAEVAKLAREYRQKTGRFDDGFYDVLSQKFGGQDLFGDIASKGVASATPSLSDIEAEILRRRKGQ